MAIGIVNKTLSLLTIGLLAAAILTISYFIVNRGKKNDAYLEFIKANVLRICLTIALIATLGSLYYSEIAGFEPCKLCWLQRIFMYPLVMILGLADARSDKKIIDYALALSFAGIIISLYHNYIYYGGRQLSSCDVSGLGESCLRRFVFEFDFVSIPMMALIAFFGIIVFSAAAKSYQNK